MQNNSNIAKYELCCVIANYGMGSRILKESRKCGVSGGTILLGEGTVKNQLLEFLDLNEIKKEIVLMLAEESIANNALEHLSQKFKMNKPNHGIAFSTPMIALIGTSSCKYNKNIENGEVDNIMYNAIFTIVDRSKAEKVVEVAEAAGSGGGTVIKARGSGIHERSTLFSMVVEPEKAVVLNITPKGSAHDIVNAITKALEIDKPGHGVIFVLDLNKTYGLYTDKE